MKKMNFLLGLALITLMPYLTFGQSIATNGDSGGNQISVTVTPTASSVVVNFDGSNYYLSGSVTYTLSNLVRGQWNPAGEMEFNLVVNGNPIVSKVHGQTINGSTALTSYSFTFSNLYFGSSLPADPTYGIRMAIWGVWSAPTNLPTAPGALPIELPVTLTKFEHHNGNLIWDTESEYDNEGFRILHSKDAESWIEEAFVPASQNRSAKNSYSYQIQNEGDYYRLEQVDNDGKTWLSEIVATSPKFALQSFFPNPSTGVIYFENTNDNQPYSMFNTSGQLMMSGKLEGSSLDLTDLPAGLYFLNTANNIHKIMLNSNY